MDTKSSLTSNVNQEATETFNVIKIMPNTINLTELIRDAQSVPLQESIDNKFIWKLFNDSKTVQSNNAVMNAIHDVVADATTLVNTDQTRLPDTLFDIIWSKKQDTLDELVADTFVCWQTSEWLVELICIDSSSYRTQSKPPLNNLAMYLVQNKIPIHGNCCLMLTRNTYINSEKSIELMNVTHDTIWDTLYHKFVKKGLIILGQETTDTLSPEHVVSNLISSILYSPDVSIKVTGFESFLPVKLTILKHSLIMYIDVRDGFRDLPINKHASALVGTKLVYGDVFIKLVGEEYEDFTENDLVNLTLACSSMYGALNASSLESPYDLDNTEAEESIDKHHIVAARINNMDDSISYSSYISNYKFDLNMNSLNAYAQESNKS